MKELKLKATVELDADKLKRDFEAAFQGANGLKDLKGLSDTFKSLSAAANEMAAAMRVAAQAASDLKRSANDAGRATATQSRNQPPALPASPPQRRPPAQPLIPEQPRPLKQDIPRRASEVLPTRRTPLLRDPAQGRVKAADFFDQLAAQKAAAQAEATRQQSLKRRGFAPVTAQSTAFWEQFGSADRSARSLLNPRGLITAGIDRLAPAMGLSAESAAAFGTTLGAAVPVMGALASGASAIAGHIMAANSAGKAFADSSLQISRILGNSFGESAFTNTLLNATGNANNPFSTITLNQIQAQLTQIQQVQRGERKPTEQLATFQNALFQLGIEPTKGNDVKNINDIVKEASIRLQDIRGSQRSAYIQDFAGMFGQDFANLIGLGPRLIDRLENATRLIDAPQTERISALRMEETQVAAANINAFNVAVSNAIGPIEAFGQSLLGQAAAFGAERLNELNQLTPRQLAEKQVALTGLGALTGSPLISLAASFLGLKSSSMQALSGIPDKPARDYGGDGRALAPASRRQLLEFEFDRLTNRLDDFKIAAPKLGPESAQMLKSYKAALSDLKKTANDYGISDMAMFEKMAATNPAIAQKIQQFRELRDSINGAALAATAFNEQYAKASDAHDKLTAATGNLEIVRTNAMQANAKGVVSQIRRYSDQLEKFDALKDDVERLDALAASYVEKKIKVPVAVSRSAPGKSGGPSINQKTEKAYWQSQRAAYLEQRAAIRAAQKPTQGSVASANIARINSDLADQRYASLAGSAAGGPASTARTVIKNEIRTIRAQRGLSKAEKARREKDLKQILAVEEDMAQEGVDMVQNVLFDVTEDAIRDIQERIQSGEFGRGLAEKEGARGRLQSGSAAAREVLADLTMRGMKETGVFDDPYSAFAIAQQRISATLANDLRAKQRKYIESGGSDEQAATDVLMSGQKLQDVPGMFNKEIRRLRGVIDASQEERLTYKMLMDYELVPPNIEKLVAEKKKIDDMVKNMLNPTTTVKQLPGGPIEAAPSVGDVATARYQTAYLQQLKANMSSMAPDAEKVAGMAMGAMSEKGAAGNMRALLERHLNDMMKDIAGGLKIPSIGEIMIGVDGNTKVQIAEDKKQELADKFAASLKDLQASGALAQMELTDVTAVNVAQIAKENAGKLASEQLKDLQAEGMATVAIADLKLGTLSGLDSLKAAVERSLPNITVTKTATVNVVTTTTQRTINRLEKDDIVVPSSGGAGAKTNSPARITPPTNYGNAVGGPGGRAIGGTVMKDRPYWVGEKGPELFMPATNGHVMDTIMSRYLRRDMTALDLNHLRPAPVVQNTQNISIDARGSTSPAAVTSAATRAARHLFLSEDPLLRARDYDRRRGILY